MASIKDKLERALAVTPWVVRAPLVPWVGFRLCTDAYETSIEVVADVQLSVARAVRVEPIRSFAATWAGAMRDVGAAQLSTARWFLDE